MSMFLGVTSTLYYCNFWIDFGYLKAFFGPHLSVGFGSMGQVPRRLRIISMSATTHNHCGSFIRRNYLELIRVWEKSLLFIQFEPKLIPKPCIDPTPNCI